MKMPAGKYACTAKMGEKGQIVIPKEARDLFGFQPGDTLLILCDKERGIAIPTPEQTQQLYQMIFRGDAPPEAQE